MNEGSELQILRDLSLALESVALEGGFGDNVMNPDKVLSKFEEIEREYTAEYSVRQGMIKKIKRSVAEWELIIAEEAGLPYKKIRPLFEEVNRMGYENVLIEFDITLLYVRVCIRSQKIQEAKNNLENMRTKLSGLPKTMARKNYEHWVDSLDEKIDKLSR